jgi:cytochrome bd-type quinol oxidase subunit 2
MKKIFSKISAATAIATVGAANVLAQGLSADAPSSIKEQTGGEGDLKTLLLTIINSFLTFLGVLAVLMVIYGGLMYIMASGDTQKADKGKKIIMYAVIGIVIILLSFALINTVLGVALGGGGAQ